MNLFEKFQVRKHKLIEGMGTDPQANRTVENYLDNYGFNIRNFTKKIRSFFVESCRHHQRLAYREAMAACLGLDMTKPSDRDALWRKVATEQGLDRKMRIKWCTGQVDPQPEHLDDYFPQFYDTHPNCKEPVTADFRDRVRMGIARTLTYIRVFPPENTLSELPDADMIPKELETCWESLRSHVHYRKHRDLNQHALDSVRDEFRDRFWMESDDIGRWKREIEGNPRDITLPFWFWPWAIFKYATTKPIHSSNITTVVNPHLWIWNSERNGRTDLWRSAP